VRQAPAKIAGVDLCHGEIVKRAREKSRSNMSINELLRT